MRNLTGYYALEENGAFVPEYQAVLNHATTQGYTLPSEAVQGYQNTLVESLVNSGKWSELDCLYLLAQNGSLEFGGINIKQPGTYDLQFTGVSFSDNTGITNLNSSSKAETLFQPSMATSPNYQLFDASYGFWMDSINLGTSNYIFGDFARNLLREDGLQRVTTGASSTVSLPSSGFIGFRRIDQSFQEWKFNIDPWTQENNYSNSAVDDGPFVLLNRHSQNVGGSSVMSAFYCGSYAGSDLYQELETYINSLP